MTFTPGSFDPERTDTYEAQKKLQEDDVSPEQEFDEAQQGLRDLNTNYQRMLGIVGALAFGGPVLGLDVIGSITALVEDLAGMGVVGLLVLAILYSVVNR